MKTNNEKFIEIQNILTISDVHPADCNKILDLIIELSKERKQLKAYTNHNYDKAKQLQQENEQLKEDISNLLDIISKNCNELKCTSDEWLVIQKYQDKEVSE